MPSDPDEASPAPKPRSCATCRSRKVRCDKKSPCSNCRRAGIACVLPTTDKTPRWAYCIERHGHAATASPSAVGSGRTAAGAGGGGGGVTQVLSRLNSLEGLIKELSGQIELQSHSKAASEASPGAGGASSSSPVGPGASPDSNDSGLARSQKQFGRLVVDETRQSRYVGTGFWTRINDEIMALKTDTQALAPDHQQHPSSDDEDDDDFPSKGTPSTLELGRTPSDRHAFFFGSSPGFAGDDLRSLHPLPSQVPFILNIFQENINSMCLIVHMPSLQAMIRKLPSSDFYSSLSAPDEALLFAIYYSTITSMEDEDVLASFGASKAELNLKYRTGLERSLSKADFLNVSSFTLVQALIIFLSLARRHDSPRYVLMVTSVVVRMAQALGMHRDGTSFAHLSPFDIEMRRRVWWTLCVLDLRSSEDQNIDPVIPHGSFDTQLPLNINTSDLDPSFTEPPVERQGLTDMTVPLVWFRQVSIMAQMTAMIAKHGPEEGLGRQLQLLSDLGDTTERLYLQHAHPATNAEYWMSVGVTRIIIAKMTLFMYLPRLFSSSSSDGKLLAAAIEIAELNHTLNSSKECAPWRWIFQTYTHWHAIVFLLLAASREEWSPMVERAWIALHSPWLIPRETTKAMMSLRTWVPLRKLMVQAKRHREAEVARLKQDPEAAQRLYDEDLKVQQPTSAGFAALEAEAGTMQELFRQRWRHLVAPEPASQGQHVSQPAVSPGGDQQYWTDMQVGDMADASFLFGDVSLSPGDLDLDLDTSMDWAQWIQSAEGTEKQGQAPFM